MLPTDMPEPVQVSAQEQSLLGRGVVSCARAGGKPLDGGVRVGVLVAGGTHSLELVRVAESRRHSSGEVQVVIRMSMPGRSHLATRVELFRRERADRLEQRIPLARPHQPDEALLDERVQFVERAVALVVGVADVLHRFECPAFVEAREPSQQQLLRCVEQRVAPADRRAQRPLPEREVAIARRQQIERMIEPLEQRRRLNHAHARRGEFERERQAVELPADCRNGRRVRRRKREVLLDLHCSLEKQCDRRTGPEGVERRHVRRRKLERRQAELGLAADLERRAARRDHLKRRTSRDERRDLLGDVDDLLQVVEHDQHAALPDHRAQRIERRAAVRLGDVQRDANVRQHRRGCRHRRERHECGAAGILRHQPVEKFDREARLASAAIPRHREQARTTAHAIHRGLQRLLTAEQGCGRRRRRLEDRRGDILCRPRAPQFVAHVTRGLDTRVRLLLQATRDDAIEIGRGIGPHARQRPGRVAKDRAADQTLRGAFERPAPGRQLVEQDAEREQVRAAVHGLAAHLLRCHVRYRADDLARSRDRRFDRHRLCRLEIGARIGELGESEIQHLDSPVVRQHDIRGLEIAVHHALVVRRRERIRERDAQLDDARDGQPARCHLPIKPLALDQLHRQEPNAVLILDRIERDDVRVVEAGDDAGFMFKSRQAFRVRGHAGRQDLERNVTTEAAIPRPIHLAHAAGAERRDDVVATESGACEEGHRQNVRYEAGIQVRNRRMFELNEG